MYEILVYVKRRNKRFYQLLEQEKEPITDEMIQKAYKRATEETEIRDFSLVWLICVWVIILYFGWWT